MAGKPGKGALQATAVVAFLAAFWCFQFSPCLLSHENILGYRLLDARITGIQASAARNSIFNRLPSQDASMLLTHYPYQYYLAACFQKGLFPLWNPLVGCGAPVTSDPQYKPFNPFFWPFFAFPSAWMFSLGIAAMALAGLIGWLLFFRETELSWLPAAAGACLMVFSPLTEQTIILSNPWAAWMAPWAMWAAERWHRRRRGSNALLAAFIALMVYVGHPLVAILYSAIVVAYLVFRPSGRSVSERGRALLVISVLTVLLTAVHTLPLLGTMREFWSYKYDWGGGPYFSWAALVNPKSEIYVPAPFWGLAIVGLLHGRRHLRYFFLSVLAYGAAVMFPWIQGVPRWILTFGGYLVAKYGEEAFWLGLIGLAALGLEAAIASPPEPFKDRLSKLRPFVYGVAWYFGLTWITVIKGNLYWPSVFRRLPFWHQYVFWETLACLVMATVFLVPGKGRTRIILFVVASFFLVLIPGRLPMPLQRYFSTTDLSLSPPAVVKRMQSENDHGAFRFSAACFQLDTPSILAPNQSLCWGISDIRLTNPLILRRYKIFSDHWNNRDWFGTYAYFPEQSPNLLAFLGARDFVTDDRGRMKALGAAGHFGGLSLQKVSEAEPWVRPVGRWVVASDTKDGWRETFASIQSGAWRNTAVLNVPPGLPATLPGWRPPHVTWLEAGPDCWRWKVSGEDACLLVVLMNDHSGWRLRLDGVPGKILRCYGTFMAVAVPAGRHDVTLSFHAPWFLGGLLASVAGWLIVVFSFFVERRRASFRPREN
jgi:hypothetical protein